YFGFTAVQRIKIVQKPLPTPVEKEKPSTPSLNGDAETRLAALLDQIEDEALRKALQRMGRGVFSSGS
ncbi:MAG: DUF721 domain-containing protein, partial [Pseudomonadota bacterium]